MQMRLEFLLNPRGEIGGDPICGRLLPSRQLKNNIDYMTSIDIGAA